MLESTDEGLLVHPLTRQCLGLLDQPGDGILSFLVSEESSAFEAIGQHEHSNADKCRNDPLQEEDPPPALENTMLRDARETRRQETAKGS